MDLGNEKMRASTKVFVLLAGCALSGIAFAQCTNDAIFNAQSTPIHAFGNTCGKNPALTSFCSGTDIPNGAGTAVVQINFGNNPAIQLELVSSTSGFNPELALTTGSCTSLSICTIDDNNGTQTVGPDSPVLPIADGATGYVFISDLNTETPGCGDYELSIFGSLPVTLQDFSVR